MRAPEFWYRPDDWRAALLGPAATLYGAGRALAVALTKPRKLALPSLCVGNLVAGGAGKTPTVIALAALLADAGLAPHILSRGWGGRLKGPLRVDPVRHVAADVGDEPLLLAGAAPTWVARDRHEGARAAADAGADLLLLDDGLQNPRLDPDFRLVVIDGETGFGNGRLLPAGPLREPVEEGLARADAVAIVGADKTAIGARIAKPKLAARIEPVGAALALKGEAVLAFAGIARPEKFFGTLKELGAKVVEAHAFGDHRRYRPEEVMALVERAAALKAKLVTTEKDRVRLPAEARSMVEAAPVALAFDDEAALLRLLAPLMAWAAAGRAKGRAASGTS